MKLASSLFFAVLLSVPAAATAKRKSKSRGGGTLSQVVGGLRTKRDDSSSSKNKKTPRRDHRSSSDDDWEDDDDWGDDVIADAVASTAVDLIFAHNPGVRAPSGKTDVDTYTSAIFVKGSDLALGSMLRVSHRWFTLSAAYDAYIEDLPMDETLTFTTWRFTGGRRWTKPGLGSVLVEGGPTGGHSTGLSMVGVVAGVTGRLAVANTAGLDASARGYIYNQGSSAVEMQGAVRLSVIRAGYRWLKFDVGPALHGPEIGLAFSF
ncbi:MAG: hypothetical protein KJO07_02535 [Deltaproteobacteria bacterium]|nr:hypothetical protein [Deltaproteobacteria bacterium]